jgi:hypothetical protein
MKAHQDASCYGPGGHTNGHQESFPAARIEVLIALQLAPRNGCIFTTLSWGRRFDLSGAEL